MFIITVDLMKKKIFTTASITALMLIAAIFLHTTAYSVEKNEQSVNFYLSWEKIPDVSEYTIKIKNPVLDTILLNQTTQATRVDGDLPPGYYQFKLIFKRESDISPRESDWLDLELGSTKYLAAPVNIRIKKVPAKNENVITAQLSWDLPSEAEESLYILKIFKRIKEYNIFTSLTGVMKVGKKLNREFQPQSYRVYMIKDGKYIEIGKTALTGYTIEGLDAAGNYQFSVRAENYAGQQSGKTDVSLKGDASGFSLGIEGCAAVPTREFYRKLKPGGGLLITFEKNFKSNFNLGFLVGFWYFAGNASNIATSYMAPLALTFGYNFWVSDIVAIVPECAAGVSIDTITNTKDDKGRQKVSIYPQPIVLAGAAVRIDPLPRFSMKIGVKYGAVFEEKVVLDFALFTLGLGMKF